MADMITESEYRAGFRTSFGSLRSRFHKSKHVSKPTEWHPLTKLGRLVKSKKIPSIENIYAFALPVREHEIIDYFIGPSLSQVMLKIVKSPAKTSAGSTAQCNTYIAIGNCNGYVGLGMQSSEKVSTSVLGAIIRAKHAIVPVRQGYWGSNIGKPHTLPCSVNGRYGDVEVRLTPAPRGTGIIASGVPRILLQLAGISDCYFATFGCTKSVEVSAMATFKALAKTNAYLALDRWTNMSTKGDEDFSSYLKDGSRSLMTRRGKVQNKV